MAAKRHAIQMMYNKKKMYVLLILRVRRNLFHCQKKIRSTFCIEDNRSEDNEQRYKRGTIILLLKIDLIWNFTFANINCVILRK